MKKIYALISLLLASFSLVSCGNQKLLILNWGEYINEELVAEFEKQYGVEVSISIADSNELFYSKVKAGTTSYDLVLPSDYMIKKMRDESLIQEINFDKLTNYDPNKSTYYASGLRDIRDSMTQTMGADIHNYYVPYFWGTFGLMYNRRIDGLEEAVQTHSWNAYFDPALRPANTRVGMYDVAQYAFATSMLSLGLDPNLEPTKENLDKSSEVLKKAGFSVWADDALKKDIQANNLDLAYVWTGDFLDMLYVDLEEGTSFKDMPYNIYIPNDTMSFVDSFVIPTKARHVDLAHEFINFFLNPDAAKQNASVVGYATPLQETFDAIATYVGEDEWLTNWALAYETYYKDNPNFTGKPYATYTSRELTLIQNMVNNIKTS